MPRPGRGWPPSSVAAWCSRSRCFSHVAWDGVVPNLVLLVVVAAALVARPAVRDGARLRRRAAARPRPAGRPRRRPLGAGAGRWWGTSPAGSTATSRPRAGVASRPSARAPRSSAPRSSRSAGCCSATPPLRCRDAARVIGVLGLVWDLLLTPFVLPLRDGRCSRRLEPERAVALMAAVRDPRRQRRPEPPQPAAPRGHPGAGVLAVRHPVRAALLPPGRQRRGVPRPGRRPSRCARSSCSRSAA